nr:PepSY domain-containing protein [Gammaproteobacteria bacterium]
MSKYKKNSKLLIGISTAFLLSGMAHMAIAAKRIVIESNNSLRSLASQESAIAIINNLNSNYQFIETKKIELPNNETRYRFSQYYQDIPVWDVALVSNKQEVKNLLGSEVLKGHFLINIEHDLVTTKHTVTKTQAEQIAIQAAGIVDIQKVSNINSKIFIKNYSDVAKIIYLVNFLVENETTDNSRPFFMIDANTGEILETWEGMNTNANMTAGKASGPGGNLKIGKYFYDKDYGPLMVDVTGTTCTMTSPNVDTYDLKNQSSGGAIHKFTCPENTYREINGGYSPINDAHYFGNIVYDLYKDWYKTAPLT